MKTHTCNSPKQWIPSTFHSKPEEKTVSQKKTPNHNNQQPKKCVTFTYHSPLIRKITNLFKHSNLNISPCATNTIHQQLTDKITNTGTKSSGICKFKCSTCNNSYTGKSDRSIATRYKEHTRYIRNNNPISSYALYILNNRHEYGTVKETLGLLKPCNKGTRMNCWEAVYMQAFYQHSMLIEEQQFNDINPLYDLANTSRGQLYVP